MPKANTERTPVSLIAAVLHEVLDAARFESLADLHDALKGRLSTLRIPWTNDGITDAIRMVGMRREVLPLTAVPRGNERLDPPPDLPREDAARLLASLLAKTGHTSAPINTMPAVEFVSQREADQRKALEMVAKEMQASIARCDALEHELEEDGGA